MSSCATSRRHRRQEAIYAGAALDLTRDAVFPTYLSGTVIDFEDTFGNRGFTIDNPNTKRS
jgi:Fe-S cluster assembly iron-binding protein IscA